MSEEQFKVEQAVYFEKCKELLQHFKKYKKLDETDAFLKSFGTGENQNGIY